jgi:hypothetical protein
MSQAEYMCTENTTNSEFWHKGIWNATKKECSCTGIGTYSSASDPSKSVYAFALTDGTCILRNDKDNNLQALKQRCEAIDGATWDTNRAPICKCPTGYMTKDYVIDSADATKGQYNLWQTSAICVPENVYKCENGDHMTNPIQNWASGYWDNAAEACKCITTSTDRSIVDNVCIKK